MSYYKNITEAWDVTNAYDPSEFQDSKVRWYDSDNDIRTARNMAYRVLLCPNLESATQTVDALFDRFNMHTPTCAKVLRAIAGTLAQCNEDNWKLNLRALYNHILR